MVCPPAFFSQQDAKDLNDLNALLAETLAIENFGAPVESRIRQKCLHSDNPFHRLYALGTEITLR
jgi:hypothetical protein